jgi:ISXO2-like transposase domain
LRGTHHGVGADHLDHYLDEFVFRFNRRFYPMAGFATLLGLGATSPPTPIEQILSPLADGATGRRPGRATGLTSGRFSIEIIERSSSDNIRADRGD